MSSSAPLSEQFRPKRFEDVVGQSRWLGEEGLIRDSVEHQRPMNLLLWGPPGSGKTTVARLYMDAFDAPQATVHPSRFQTAEVKGLLDRAANRPLFRPTLLWIDEIHRLSRPQQDLLLQGIEEGSICLVSATTENPSFVLSNALLSRLHVLSFQPLDFSDLEIILKKVLLAYPKLSFSPEAAQFLIEQALGDARKLLSLMDPLAHSAALQRHYETAEELRKVCSSHTGAVVAHGEGRYLLISALHKAVRGSDENAALYWLSRLFHSGEDRLYIGRRIIRMAIEDIGLADPQALQIALRAHDCYKTLGSPEGELALAEAVVYLSLSPKSAACYVAMKQALEHAAKTGHILPPKHILNAPTRWMEKEGFGSGYIWDHDEPDAVSGQRYFPQGVAEQSYYLPVERGFERDLLRRQAYFSKLRSSKEKTQAKPEK